MARAISLLLACTCSAGLLFLPAMRGGQLTPAAHGLLMPLFLSICGCFAHGLGYRPASAWLRRVLAAWVLWPSICLLACGFVLAF